MPAEIPTPTVTQLKSLLDRLPQELYDDIYNLTFTANPGGKYYTPLVADKSPSRRINRSIKDALGHPRADLHSLFKSPNPIALLHVDRASRQKFAESFFSGEGTSFTVKNSSGEEAFLGALDPAHRGLVREIKVMEGLVREAPASFARFYRELLDPDGVFQF